MKRDHKVHLGVSAELENRHRPRHSVEKIPRASRLVVAEAWKPDFAARVDSATCFDKRPL